jgi:hypothetical protein
MSKVKLYITYAIGLIVGLFCGKLVARVLGDIIGLRGSDFYSSDLMIPTNLSGGIELLVTIVVFIAAIEIVDRTGLLK